MVVSHPLSYSSGTMNAHGNGSLQAAWTRGKLARTDDPTVQTEGSNCAGAFATLTRLIIIARRQSYIFTFLLVHKTCASDVNIPFLRTVTSSYHRYRACAIPFSDFLGLDTSSVVQALSGLVCVARRSTEQGLATAWADKSRKAARGGRSASHLPRIAPCG